MVLRVTTLIGETNETLIYFTTHDLHGAEIHWCAIASTLVFTS